MCVEGLGLPVSIHSLLICSMIGRWQTPQNNITVPHNTRQIGGGVEEAWLSFALSTVLLALVVIPIHTAGTMEEHHEGSNDFDRRENSSAPFLILHAVSDNSSSSDHDDDDSFQQMDASRPSRKILKRLRKNNPNFRRLDLEDGYMTEWFYRNSQNIVDFLDALRQNTTVEHVSVSGEFMAAMTEIMEAAVDARASSTNANANANTIGTIEHEEGVECQFLNAVSSLPALHTLEIQEVMDFNGIALPVPLLRQIMRQATKLENLTLRFVELAIPSSNVEENDFDASISSLTNGADQNQRNNTTLMEAFLDHPSLREVTFAQLRLGEGLALNTLLRGLASIPNLRKARIHMSHQRQEERRRSYQRHANHDLEDDDGIDRQASLTPICESKTLELLEVSSLRILDESKMLKAIHASASLKSLELSFTHLTFWGWASVAHLLQLRQEPEGTSNNKNNSATTTNNNNCDSNSCGSLECLRLDHMAGLDNATMYVLCHALIPKTNVCIPTLKELRLYNVMDMGAKSWVAIVEMIAANQSLSLLSLENCQGMDDDAVVGIANALAENTTLRQLELQVFAGHCTRFSQTVGQQALVDVLLTGKNITLNHFDSQASGKHQAQLEFYLKLNRTGVRQYVLGKEPLGEGGHEDGNLCKEFWKQLSIHMGDLDVLFYVLQTNPPFVMTCLRAL